MSVLQESYDDVLRQPGSNVHCQQSILFSW